MLKLLSFRGAAVFEVDAIPADTSRIEHLFEVLDQAFCVVISRFIPALAGVSGYDEYAISALGKCPHDHVGRNTRGARHEDGEDCRGILCPDCAGHVRRPVTSLPADERGNLGFE